MLLTNSDKYSDIQPYRIYMNLTVILDLCDIHCTRRSRKLTVSLNKNSGCILLVTNTSYVKNATSRFYAGS